MAIALCLADVDYQRFRALVRSAVMATRIPDQAAGRAARDGTARCATPAPHHQASVGPAGWADADPTEVRRWLQAAGAQALVHGHTHRPADETLAPGLQRHVLSDWAFDGGSARRRRAAPHRAGPPASATGLAVIRALWQGWRAQRERRVLEHRAIPDALWQATLSDLPFLARRAEADLAELRRLATLFLSEKEFSGANGLVVDDAMAVHIAAQACLPVLRFGLAPYRSFVGIVLQPDEVVARRSVADDNGVVHEYDEVLAGEAMEGGPVMLSWCDVRDAGESADWSYNVVVHEFVHVLDMGDGEADGVPPLPTAKARAHWQGVLDLEYERFCRCVDDGDETVLGPLRRRSAERVLRGGRGGVLRQPGGDA